MSALLTSLLVSSAVHAAEVTELAPFLRGDGEMRFDMSTETARLVEGDTAVGTRTLSESLLTFSGAFTVAPGVGIYAAIPLYTGAEVSYADAQQMIIDPTSDSGTMLDTGTLEPQPSLSGGGPGGAWIGLQTTPFSRALFPDRPDNVDWLFDVGFRFGDKSSFYVTDETGTSRGAGPGSPAFRIRSAFSTAIRFNEPYLVMSWTQSGRLQADLRDSSGNVLVQDATLRPASEALFRAGTEIVAASGPATGARFAVDLHGDFGYRTWQDVPSGTFLPSVLDTSRGLVATQGETAFARAGIELDYRIMEWVELDLGFDMGTVLPYRVEHFYDVWTRMGATTWALGGSLEFHGRDRPERMPWEAT